MTHEQDHSALAALRALDEYVEGCSARGFGLEPRTVLTITKAAIPALEATLRERDELLAALESPPIPPSDLDTDDGRQAYVDGVLCWLDTTCAKAIAKAKGEATYRCPGCDTTVPEEPDMFGKVRLSGADACAARDGMAGDPHVFSADMCVFCGVTR